jgi:hypothetical protein
MLSGFIEGAPGPSNTCLARSILARRDHKIWVKRDGRRSKLKALLFELDEPPDLPFLSDMPGIRPEQIADMGIDRIERLIGVGGNKAARTSRKRPGGNAVAICGTTTRLSNEPSAGSLHIFFYFQ